MQSLLSPRAPAAEKSTVSAYYVARGCGVAHATIYNHIYRHGHFYGLKPIEGTRRFDRAEADDLARRLKEARAAFGGGGE